MFVLFSKISIQFQRTEELVVDTWALQIGAKVLTTFSPIVTHVIINMELNGYDRPPLEFLFGVANGSWIVGFEWVYQSMRRDPLRPHPVDELPFEALDQLGRNGPSRSRLKANGEKKLFEEFEFCCPYGSVDFTVKDRRRLLELCGAATVEKPEDLTKSRRHTMIVVDPDSYYHHIVNLERDARAMFDEHQVYSVSIKWIVYCLGQYKLCPVVTWMFGLKKNFGDNMKNWDDQLLYRR